jgi:hypothetical protein
VNKTMREMIRRLADATSQEAFVMLIPERGAVFHAKYIWYWSGNNFPAAQFTMALANRWIEHVGDREIDGTAYPIYRLTWRGRKALEAAA